MERLNVSFEPMDIDLSSQSVKDMDISYHDDTIDEINTMRKSSPSPTFTEDDHSSYVNNIIPNQQPIIKNYHINIQKRRKTKSNTFLKAIVGIIVLIISFLVYQVHNLKCCEHLNLELLEETLSTKIKGQSSAINLLINTLELQEKTKIIFFSGGTGVGKTLTSSTLLSTLGPFSNVYHYTMPTFETTFSSDLKVGLTFCKKSIIIVDDLTINDIQIIPKFFELIKKVEALDKEITVILIYNCNDNQDFQNQCDKSFSSKLLNNFSDIKAFKRLIQFEPLTKTNLRECVKQELGDRKLNDNEFEELLRKFDVSVDGCKGVHSKLKYLNIV